MAELTDAELDEIERELNVLPPALFRRRYLTALRETRAKLREVERLVGMVASAPFPIHDHVPRKDWERACELYSQNRAAIDAARAAKKEPKA